MLETDLEAQVGAALRRCNWTIGAAESCTGGLLLHRLTNIPGSSAYVLGGVVAYANSVKINQLGVKPVTLDRYGAVSAEVAGEMLDGLHDLLGVDVAVSITGIAGPGGGTPDKPVGLTYIGISARPTGLHRVDRHVWDGDRLAVKVASADEALRKVLAAVPDTI